MNVNMDIGNIKKVFSDYRFIQAAMYSDDMTKIEFLEINAEEPLFSDETFGVILCR